MSTSSPKQPGGKPSRGTSYTHDKKKYDGQGEGASQGGRGGGKSQPPGIVPRSGGSPSGHANGQQAPKQHSSGGLRHSGSRERNMPTPSSVLEDALLHALGQMVTVTLKNGEKWTGVFHGANAISHLAPSAAQEATKEKNKKWGFILRMASRVTSGDEGKGMMEKPVQSMLVEDNDLVAVRFVLPKRATKSFQTDAEIGLQTGSVNTDRNLTTWASTVGAAGASGNAHPAHTGGSGAQGDEDLAYTLEDRGHVVGSWNQFDANAGMLNRAAMPYREDLYTTELDRSSAYYQQKVAEATRLAREIEGATSEDKHTAEERGHLDQGEDDMDEEDRYSMVLSDAKRKGTYVVPALRAKEGSASSLSSAGSGSTGQVKGASNGSPKNSRSSSPRLSGLNLATGTSPAGEKKAFQPYSMDPAKNTTTTVPNPATRTEDTAKLRKSSTEFDEKVRRASSNGTASPPIAATATEANNGAASPDPASAAAATASKAKRDMRSFANATAWVAPGQRKGQEIFESLGGAAHSPVSPTLTSVPNVPPQIASPPGGMMPAPQSNMYPLAHGGPSSAMQHPMMMNLGPSPMNHTQAQGQAPPPSVQVDASASSHFKSLIRSDVHVRPITDFAKLTPTSLEPKVEWERKIIISPYYGFPNQQYAFAQAIPGMPPAIMMGAAFPQGAYAPPAFMQPHP